jgi:hypothetical protein
VTGFGAGVGIEISFFVAYIIVEDVKSVPSFSRYDNEDCGTGAGEIDGPPAW